STAAAGQAERARNAAPLRDRSGAAFNEPALRHSSRRYRRRRQNRNRGLASMTGEGTIANAAGSTNSMDGVKIANVGVVSVLARCVDAREPAVSTAIPTMVAAPAMMAS